MILTCYSLHHKEGQIRGQIQKKMQKSVEKAPFRGGHQMGSRSGGRSKNYSLAKGNDCSTFDTLIGERFRHVLWPVVFRGNLTQPWGLYSLGMTGGLLLWPF
jgi:hypothetical protein